MKIPLTKLIAQSGYCSRRQAEELIRLGRVKINGRVAKLGETGDQINDKVAVKNRLLGPAPEKIYIRLNKPTGYTCTNRRFAGEKSVLELIPLSERLFTAGRLDKDSRGLLILTNDGDFALRLSHPRFEKEKIYEARVKEKLSNPQAIVERLKHGVEIGEGDGVVRAKRAQYLQNNIFSLTLSEGKKRQVRRMFKALGLNVIDLVRTAMGELTLDGLAEGKWQKIREQDLEKVIKQ